MLAFLCPVLLGLLVLAIVVVRRERQAWHRTIDAMVEKTDPRR